MKYYAGLSYVIASLAWFSEVSPSSKHLTIWLQLFRKLLALSVASPAPLIY